MEDLEFLVFHPLNMPYIDKMFSTISFGFDLLLKESSPCYFKPKWSFHSNTPQVCSKYWAFDPTLKNSHSILHLCFQA
jgi:hypothetical protein